MITYIIKFIICSGLLLAVYRGFLSNERLYKFNRFYLLFSLLFSLAVPFITINAPAINLPYFNAVTEQPVTKPINTATENAIVNTGATQLTNITESTVPNNELTEQPGSLVVVQAPAHNYWPQFLLVIYGLVAAVLLFRFAKNSRHISHIVGKSAVVNHNNTKLVLIDEDITPHSFLNYVFVNKDAYESGDIEPEIICHEQTHIRQLHSLDVIFIELLQIACWFNPFIIFYRTAIQLNHEFLADEAVIENYNNTKAYQYLLLAKISQAASLNLTSQFNYLITKKRLIMMTKITSSTTAWFVRLAILPIATVAFLLFCNKTIATPKLVANKAIKKINTVNAIKPAVQEPASKKPGVKRPMPMARILITYPSTKAGASPQQLKEYAAIEAKYINATETTKFIKKSDIAAADRAKMEELFAKMSKEQQYKQMIAFSFGMPFPKNVPTQAQLDTWANDRQYKITIDSKLSSGAELAKYKAADFSYFYKAHIEWQVHRKYKYQHYEIQLMTTPYFNAKNKDRVENSFVFNNMQPPLRVAKPVSSKNEKAAIEVEQPAAAVVTKINYIIITGEVMYPGTYPTQKGEIYLQEYLKRAGGITTHGSAENVRVYRGGKLVNTGLSTGNSESILLPGDSIYVARL